MSYLGTTINDSPIYVGKNAADLEGKAFHAVKFDSNGEIALCSTEGEAVLGLLPAEAGTKAAGDDIAVQIKDIGLMVASGAIAAGAEVMTDANGKAKTATAGNFIIGYALKAATAAGDVIPVQIQKGVMPGGSGDGQGGSLPDNFPAEGVANANLYFGFDENGLYSTKTPPTVESPFFDVEFSYGAAGWAPNSVTIAQILAAINNGKIPRAIVELGTGTHAYGFICTSVDTQEQKAVAFSINISLEGTVTNYVFIGSVDNGADTWNDEQAQYIPDPGAGNVGDVVTIDLAEDGETHIAAWKTPQ